MTEPTTPPTPSAAWRDFEQTAVAESAAVLSQSVSDALGAAQERDTAVKIPEEDSKFSLITVAIGVLVVFIIASVVWFWPHPEPATVKHALDLSARADLKVVPETEPAPVAIAGVASISGKNDGWDHPELAGLAIDGKPETSWRTAAMRDANLVGGRGFGLAINLGDNPVRVRKVVVTSSAKGGQLELRLTTADHPSGGTLLGAMPLADTTTFELATPVETNQLVLWSTNLPTAPGGGFRLMVSEVQVLG